MMRDNEIKKVTPGIVIRAEHCPSCIQYNGALLFFGDGEGGCTIRNVEQLSSRTGKSQADPGSQKQDTTKARVHRVRIGKALPLRVTKFNWAEALHFAERRNSAAWGQVRPAFHSSGIPA